MISRRIVVHGDVHGVGYRYSCLREATSLGVRGWVRNRSDGTVEILAEGEPAAVQSLIAWARRGPAHASVSHVEVSEEAPGGRTDFRVEP